MHTHAVILAAGKGSRMKSKNPNISKVSYEILRVPLVRYVVDAVKPLIDGKLITVVGHGGEVSKQIVENDSLVVWQHEQLGTGHAVEQAAPILKGVEGTTLIINGDTPLFTTRTLERLLKEHKEKGHDLTVLSAVLDNPTGYGRIIRNEDGFVKEIVEHADASEAQRRVQEVNTGVMVYSNKFLFEGLEQLDTNNVQGELYLTDLIKLFKSKGLVVGASIMDNPIEMSGINDRVQLADAAKEMQRAINRKHMLAGVTIEDPTQTYIGPYVEIEPDTIIAPGTSILGVCKIGSDNYIGPNTYLENTNIGSKNNIISSYLTDTNVGDNNELGPYLKTRANTNIGNNCRVGNFVELKNATLHNGVKSAHLTYIGDSEIGEQTNIGAGTITANYDGKNKYKTKVGKNAFIGSGTILIAPIEVKDGAFTAAGSTITDDVEEDELAIARSEQINKPGLAKKYRKK